VVRAAHDSGDVDLVQSAPPAVCAGRVIR
jgi:hypothetical protein